MKRLLIYVSTLAMVLAGAALAWASFGIGLKDEGVGMYTDPSVANQVSSFTINRVMVSCGVGTFNSGGAFGPFEMLMYAVDMDHYTVERNVPRTITATGTMRSITRVGGVTVEDTNGAGTNSPPPPFIAIAEDKDPPSKDHFAIHFTTPFWKPGNPMCTPSNKFPGLCMFGGDVFLGNITVGQ